MLMPKSQESMLRVIVLYTVLSLGACANVGPDNVPTAITAPSEDNFTGVNKVVHDFNKMFDRYVMRPLANTNNSIVPKPAQKGISNFFKNLAEPWTAINQILQLDFKAAWKTTKRFTVNTTWGVAGFFNRAKDWNLPRVREDFGQTLAVWGVKPGPYLVVPFLGPSNVRDTFSFGVDVVFDPPNYWAIKDGKWELAAARTVANAVQFRSANFEVVTEYIERYDSYDRLKLFYEQTRAFQIRNGLAAPDEVDDMFVDEPDCYPADEALEGDVICEDENLKAP